MDIKNISKKIALVVVFTAVVIVIYWLVPKNVRDAVTHNSYIILLAGISMGGFFYGIIFHPAAKLKHTEKEIEKDRSGAEQSRTRFEEKVQKLTAELSSATLKLTDKSAEHPLDQKRLQERVKHLNCLYRLSELVHRSQISLDQICQETTELIRNAYQYPSVTCVRITLDGVQYRTDNFRKTESSQYAQIEVRREKVGAIETYYLGDKHECDEGHFLKEEHDLLNELAKQLGRISERKAATEKLQLFQNLMDRSNDCIFVIEPQWGRFVDVNDRACEKLGYMREELVHMTVKNIDELIPDDTSWQDYVERLKLEEDAVEERRNRRKNGTTFPVEISLKFISQGKRDYIIAITRDITERKKAEERQAKLIQELKDFAYIISHDLKAPLRGIKTLADWLSTDYKDKLDEDGREHLKLLLARVGRMHNLIDGVLQYSRVGRAKEKESEVNLNELIPEVIDMVAPPENISITVENELPVIKGEQTRIIQMFENLLSNAAKYMNAPQGRIKIGCVEENGFWKFSVADNGPGIDKKHFEKIFQIFQTLSPRDEFESTGIGLTVIKKIVELYGGKIWVDSKLGEGSTFYFTWPKEKEEVTDAELKADIAY